MSREIDEISERDLRVLTKLSLSEMQRIGISDETAKEILEMNSEENEVRQLFNSKRDEENFGIEITD